MVVAGSSNYMWCIMGSDTCGKFTGGDACGAFHVARSSVNYG